MSLVVKYCGGCNPLYNRVKLVQEVSQILDIEPVYGEPESGDIYLLISGCSRGCLKSSPNKNVITIEVSSYEEPNVIAQKIMEAQKKKGSV